MYDLDKIGLQEKYCSFVIVFSVLHAYDKPRGRRGLQNFKLPY